MTIQTKAGGALMVLAAASGAFAQQASKVDGVAAFAGHPVHCAVMLGGPGHENDSGSGEYSQALSLALDALVTDVDVSMRFLVERCRAEPLPQGASEG